MPNLLVKVFATPRERRLNKIEVLFPFSGKCRYSHGSGQRGIALVTFSVSPRKITHEGTLTSNSGHTIGRKSFGTPFHANLRSVAMFTSSADMQSMNFCRLFDRIDRSRSSFEFSERKAGSNEVVRACAVRLFGDGRR